MEIENWYLKNKSRIWREIKFAIPRYKRFIARQVRLLRTRTIAQGGSKCDFRFCRGQAVEVLPDFMKN